VDLSVDLTTATRTIADGGAALAAAARANPDAAVAWCPGWTVRSAVEHTGLVHQWAAAIVTTGGRATFPSLESPPADLGGWSEEQAAGVLDALAATDPARPTWAFGPMEPARFWWRRQAHETAVHAYDASAAAGTPWVIPPEVASDGLAEFLERFVIRMLGRSNEWGAGRTVHFHTHDATGEWLVTIADPPAVTQGHAKGDLAVRGPAADVLLWAMGRPGLVELLGDEGLAVAWGENISL
jgi:uncharacterized protein (TIGR03083 family)